MDAPRFMADQNVGKLARLMRMLGFDTLFFDGRDDGEMVRLVMEQGRIILTRDTRIMQRKVVTSGRLKALLFVTDRPTEQICQTVKSLGLKDNFRPFSLCIEDNHPLEIRQKEAVKDRVPPYVFQTQAQYMECLHCRRIYWRGTHWQAMMGRIDKL